jgi:hypothetical protein
VVIQSSYPAVDTGLELWVDPLASGIEANIYHSVLLGLAADDHPQYQTEGRGDARYVKKAGDTVTGQLLLPAPSQPSSAARKQDVDAISGRTISAGNGLTGGGALDADRTIHVGAGSGIAVAANEVTLDLQFADVRYMTRADSEAVIASTAAASGTPSTGVGTIWVQF